MDNLPVSGYCDGCSKIKDGKCLLYTNPTAKVRTHGCSFSPIEIAKAAIKGAKEKADRQKKQKLKAKK